MNVKTQTGRTEIDASACIRTDGGLVGLPDARRFRIVDHREDSPFHWLQSLDDPKLALAVIYPVEHFRDYSFDLPDADAQMLALDRAEDAVVLTTVTIDTRRRRVTTNLLGPIVVNKRTLAARQVVLSNEDFAARQVLFQMAPAGETGEDCQAEAA